MATHNTFTIPMYTRLLIEELSARGVTEKMLQARGGVVINVDDLTVSSLLALADSVAPRKTAPRQETAEEREDRIIDQLVYSLDELDDVIQKIYLQGSQEALLTTLKEKRAAFDKAVDQLLALGK